MGGSGRWAEFDALFRAALDVDAGERTAFVRAAAGDDRTLREEVLGLLNAQSESARFLEVPLEAVPGVPWDDALAEAYRAVSPGLEAVEELDRSGERIGPYRLLRRLGHGGMATVYLAERADGLWTQRVALKLVRRGLDTEDVIRRFLAERQILSSLGHPHIARLLDGGTTEAGLPYLVLEYVKGTRITDYCDAHTLGLEGRLRLFCDVGRAVQHAHRGLVVHRDLKPSNILVDPDGRVKLLDFGIAKILDPEARGTGTHSGLRPLTPEYASPEQIIGDVITTASDVYQLGLLLGQLLCGRRPYDIGNVSPARTDAFLERMRPSAPSALVSAEAARVRRMAPDQLRRRLRGDLDTIVLQAVRREPERRYPSAEALVADLERHAAGLPISARPATLWYRVRKLAGRRPWLLPAVAAALVAVGGYVVTLARYTEQLERERNVAHLEAERAAEVQEFLVDVFRSADPYAPADPGRGRAVTVLEATEMGVERARTELSDRPDLQGALLAAVADVYSNLDLREPARELRTEALELQRTVHGTRSAEVARGLRKLGSLLALDGQVDSAEVLLVRSLELTRAVHGPSDTAVAGVLTDLARLSHWKGDLGEAEEHLVTAIEMLRSHDPLPTAHLATAYASLLDIYPINQRLEEARAAGEEAVRLSRLAYGPEHPRTALALVELADLHDWEGHPERAVPRYREAIRVLDASLGPEHERTLRARNNLAVTLRNLGDLAGAETVHRRVLAAWRTKREEPDWRLGDALQNMAILLQEQGRLDEAIALLREARKTYDAVLPPAHYRRAYPRLALAAVRIEQNEFESAERSARESADILESVFARPNYLTAMADCRLGRALAGQGRLATAHGLLESSVETLVGTSQPSSRYEIECRRALAAVYRELGQADLAESQLAAVRALEGTKTGDPAG